MTNVPGFLMKEDDNNKQVIGDNESEDTTQPTSPFNIKDGNMYQPQEVLLLRLARRVMSWPTTRRGQTAELEGREPFNTAPPHLLRHSKRYS